MDAIGSGIALSLLALTITLAALASRGLVRVVRDHVGSQLAWGAGLGLAAVATLVELVVYLGFVDLPLLQAYVFLSAAIVGVLSLGCTHVIRNARFRAGYTAYTLATCALVGGLSFATPLPGTMVSGGVISGNPPLTLLVLSTLVTGPATVVLLAAVILSLRKSWQWRTVMMGIGAAVLAAGGALYIASFPAALYYAEFLGVILIFLGLVTLPHVVAIPTGVRKQIRTHG
ncbi:MAG: hypothetical protein ABSA63_08215 [Thermoplasmata archaeon]|jgi:hypothetical protein